MGVCTSIGFCFKLKIVLFSLPLNTNYSVSQKNVRHFYIFDNFTRSGLILITFFTVKFRRDLWRKTELKLTGNATTDLMAGDSINLNFLHGSFLNLTVEKLRKFVKVIAKIKVVNFFLRHGVEQHPVERIPPPRLLVSQIAG